MISTLQDIITDEAELRPAKVLFEPLQNLNENSLSAGRVGANPVGDSRFEQVPVEKMNLVPSKFRESFRRRR